MTLPSHTVSVEPLNKKSSTEPRNVESVWGIARVKKTTTPTPFKSQSNQIPMTNLNRQFKSTVKLTSDSQPFSTANSLEQAYPVVPKARRQRPVSMAYADWGNRLRLQSHYGSQTNLDIPKHPTSLFEKVSRGVVHIKTTIPVSESGSDTKNSVARVTVGDKNNFITVVSVDDDTLI